MSSILFLFCDERNSYDCRIFQAEADRFEREVIAGGPTALPGVYELLNQVSKKN